jgi:hypothetical protein
VKPKWLNRTLVLGPHLCLCLSEDEYLAAAKHAGWPKEEYPWCQSTDSARTHAAFDCSKPTAIVCLNAPEYGSVGIAGLLAHEATHIWLDWLRSMGEDSPGDEVSAYAIQNLVVMLMDEWARRTEP